jgi:glycerophosphoryl diester phosphodiesterase
MMRWSMLIWAGLVGTAVLGAAASRAGEATPSRARARSRPVVIAHRGASADRPEHTLAAYELAIERGADFIEADLVRTKDGVLVARHEHALALLAPDGSVREATTDVADRPEFADRKATKRVDDRDQRGWFVEDFTLAELKTLRARERLPRLRPASAAFDGRFPIPTFDEVLDLAARASATTGRTIGVYPETKSPTYFRAIGLPLEEPLAEALRARGLDRPDAPVFVQSFEAESLRRLSTLTRAPLVLLVGPSMAGLDPHLTPDGLKALAAYARGIGPHKDLIVPRTSAGRLGEPTGLVADAHAAGLLVHPWTFRPENAYLPADRRRGDDPAAHGDLAGELRRFLDLGVDGVFSDEPGAAARAVGQMLTSGG